MRFLLALAVLLLAAATLAACNGAALLNTLTPSGSFDRERSVAYGPLPRQTLDVYRADAPRPGAPTVVFVHGGGWNAGSKSMYKFIGDSFAKEGFHTVVPNYRLHPDAVYPDTVEDTARAAQWAVEAFGRPVVLVGHSAGGYNILQAAFAPEISRAAGLDVCASVAGLVPLAAPTGVFPLTEEPYITVFPDRFTGDDAPFRRAEAGFVDVPRTLFVQGDADRTVRVENSTRFAPLLGDRAELLVLPDRSHVDTVRLLARLFEDDSPLKAEVVRFIDALPAQGPFCR